jgi:hypothetical protein
MELSLSRNRDHYWKIPVQTGLICREHVTVAAATGAGTITAGMIVSQTMVTGASNSDETLQSSNITIPGDMACCPEAKSSAPDCQKTCPSVAFCSTALVQLCSIASYVLPLPIPGKQPLAGHQII